MSWAILLASLMFAGSATGESDAAERLDHLVVGGDPDAIRAFFAEEGVPSCHGVYPLHTACLVGKHRTRGREVVRLLLEAGFHVNREDPLGWVPLHNASQEGDEEIVRMLLEKGAEVNVTDRFHGRTPLHLAVAFRHEAIMGLLINRGADKDAVDTQGTTPRTHATMTCPEMMARMF